MNNVADTINIFFNPTKKARTYRRIDESSVSAEPEDLGLRTYSLDSAKANRIREVGWYARLRNVPVRYDLPVVHDVFANTDDPVVVLPKTPGSVRYAKYGGDYVPTPEEIDDATGEVNRMFVYSRNDWAARLLSPTQRADRAANPDKYAAVFLQFVLPGMLRKVDVRDKTFLSSLSQVRAFLLGTPYIKIVKTAVPKGTPGFKRGHPFELNLGRDGELFYIVYWNSANDEQKVAVTKAVEE